MKRLARELLDTLKAERLVLEWLGRRIYAAASIGPADRLKARSVRCPPCFLRSNWAYINVSSGVRSHNFVPEEV